MLNPHPEGASNWAIAFGMSTALHAAVFVYAFDLLPFDTPTPASAMAFPEISISSAVLEETTLTAMAPDAEPEPTPETLAPVPDAETAQEPEPESLTPEEVLPEPETAAAAEPETATAPPPETLSPILPEEGVAIQGSVLTPVQPAAPSAAVLAPAGPTVTPLAAVNALPEAPEPAAAPATPPPTEEELALLEIVERIRARLSDQCLVALPQAGGGANRQVVMMSDQDRTMAAFGRDVLSDPALPVELTNILIDARQCPALDFIRERPNYPTFRVDMQLRSRDVPSGDRLVGNLRGVAGRYTSLLLVDDNGVVQDLRRFTQFVGGQAEFDIPVTRDGAARDTSQLLLAIVTDRRPEAISAGAGRLAADFFGPLKAELGNRGLIAVLPFVVR